MDSLRDLWVSSKSLIGCQCLIRMDQAFFDYLHVRTASDGVDAFCTLSEHFMRVVSAPTTSSSKAPLCTTPIQWTRHTVINGTEPGFMGPLCCPMTKALTLSTVRNNKDSYWVTEKSDGIRVIFTSFLAQRFPRWRIECQRAGDDGQTLLHRRNVSFVDNIFLEGAFNELLRGSATSSQIRLSFGTHTMRRPTTARPSNVFELVRNHHAGDVVACDTSTYITVSRDVTPRHFSYVFDRSVSDTYLLLDEYPFLNLDAVVLDAELVMGIASHSSQRRLFFAAFDCFAIQERSPTNAPLDLASPSMPESVRLLQREPLSARITVMKNSVIPYLQRTGEEKPFLTVSIPVILKNMVKVDSMADAFFPHLASQLEELKQPGEIPKKTVRFLGYPGLGVTANDGFIFTPENFDIVSGSNPKQLKWKWPDMLSVDWKVATVPSLKAGESGSSDLVNCQVSLFFKKKRADGHHQSGHTQFSRSLKLRNPHRLELPAGIIQTRERHSYATDAPGAIVECVFDSSTGNWVMEKVRSEKAEANSVVTAISVLEGIAEAFDLSTLCALLEISPACPIPTFSLPRAPVEPTAEVLPPKPCKLLLRVVDSRSGNHDVLSQWVVKLADVKNVIPCNHRPVDVMFGLGEPVLELCSASKLRETLMLNMANAGGCFAWSNIVCDAFFDGSSGRWGIVKVYPDLSSNSCFYTGVVEHLVQVARYRAFHGTFPSLPEGLNGPLERTPVAALGDVLPFPLSIPSSSAAAVQTNEHYADRARVLSSGNQQRSNVRRMNNFIKSVLMQSGFGLLQSDGAGRDRFSAADVCCGRGGDLQKWRCHPLSLLLMVDSCFEAVAEAAARYATGAGLSTRIPSGKEGFPGIAARFFVRDCFETLEFEQMISALQNDEFVCSDGSGEKEKPSASGQQSALLLPPASALAQSAGGFDIVSCQFSMHYGFSNESRVRAFLRNVSYMLRKGGVFIGTTVDDRVLLERRQKYGKQFGNELYRIQFQTDDDAPHGDCVYGEAYAFSVEECVEAQVEYVVHWKAFVELAATEYQLTLIESSNFREAFDEHACTELGQKILRNAFRERDGDGGIKRNADGMLTLQLDDDEKEICFLYRAFIFRKE